MNHTSLYYDDICDFKLHKSYKIPFSEINQKLFNSSAFLGKAPLGSLEDVKTTQEIINDINKYNDTRSQIAFGALAAKTLNSYILPDNAEKFVSYFDFIEKKQIFGISAATQDKDILNTVNGNSNSACDSKLMKDFMRRKKKQNVKKPEDDAPVTITSKHQLTRFNKPDEIIRRYTNAELQFNIPMNVNLSHIAQFATNSTSMDNYFNEEHEIIVAPQAQIFSDDDNSYQTPVDMLKSHNVKQNSNYSNNLNNNANNNFNCNNTQSNYNSFNNTQNNYNTNNNNNNNNSSNNFNNNNFNFNNNQNNQQANQNINKPETRNIPIAPSFPISAVNTSVTMPVIPEAPKIPQAPSVSQVPLPSHPKPIELKQEKDDLRVRLPAVKRASMADEIFLAAERRRNTTKITQDDLDKIAEKIKNEKAPRFGRGGLLEALKSDNPIARLKKSGTLVVNTADNICKFYKYLLLFI